MVRENFCIEEKYCLLLKGQGKILYLKAKEKYYIKRPRKNTTLKGQVLVHALTTIAPQVVNYELILQFKLLQSPEAPRRSCIVKKLQKSD